ncbi:MAG: hypothetical protein QM305_09675 [Bacteroidota bacterium]|jgi:hypothetical protein|nr:hypothetical protein [Bacteroidota bacterium]
MKQQLKNTDRVLIIKSLKSGMFPVHELKHLTNDIQDHDRTIEIFGEYSLPLTMNDKRSLLKALRDGHIDFDTIPDLKAGIAENAFLKIMKAATAD